MVVQAIQLPDIISESVLGTLYLGYCVLALIPFFGWRAWRIWHWIFGFRFSSKRVRYDENLKAEIRSRVSMYACLWLLVFYTFSRLFGIFFLSIPDFVTNYDLNDMVFKAIVMSLLNVSNLLQYPTVSLVILVWLNVCIPFLNIDEHEDTKWYKRKDVVLRWFIAIPLLVIANIVGLVGVSSVWVISALSVERGFDFAMVWFGYIYDPCSRAADTILMVLEVLLGLLLGVLMYRFSQRQKRFASDHRVARQKMAFLKVSIAVIAFFILWVYRIIGLVTMVGRMPFWLYNIFARFLVETALIFIIVFLFWPFKPPKFLSKLLLLEPLTFTGRFSVDKTRTDKDEEMGGVIERSESRNSVSKDSVSEKGEDVPVGGSTDARSTPEVLTSAGEEVTV